MNFADVMKKESVKKFTENGAMAYDRLNGALITLFGQIGALRPRTEEEIEDKFARAFNEDRLLATKMLFYCGDIRHGGLGERRTFRICLKWLANNHPSIVAKNIWLIPYFNRWDSMFELVGTSAEKFMWFELKNQFANDIKAMENNKPCSLLAKWLPSETASNAKKRELARLAMYKLGLSPRQYRKTLSKLRKYIDVVERSMSAGEWGKINYSAVPSYAMTRYNEAFLKHDPEGYGKYLEDVKNGKQKVNGSVLYPYDLVRKSEKGNPSIIDEQWKALPNYIEDDANILVMADVSGSMCGRPMETSIGLAIYFAERAKSVYHNLYMTFTDQPHFVQIQEGATLRDKVRQVKYTDMGYNTDLEFAFNYILDHAIKNNVSNKEMPKALVVISDMEIDMYLRNYGLDFVGEMKKRFEEHSYSFPKLITWNVEARHDTFLSQAEDVVNISGQSVSAFKSVFDAIKGKTGYETMLEVLNSGIYNCVSI